MMVFLSKCLPLLVPRAARLFESAGFEVVPDFVPSAPSLLRTQVAMREMHGRLVVRLLEWV